MFKKTLISLAVASSLGLTGCFDSGSDTKNANPDPKYKDSSIDGKTWPIFNPATSQLPLPNDLIFDREQGDGTFGVADSTPPVTTALNELSGASTVAPAVVQTNGQLDPETVVYGETVHLIELSYASGDPVQALSIGEPPTLGLAETGTPVLARADVETLSGTSAIRILPLEPLEPRKRYVVLVTTGVKDINGDAIVQDPVYSNITAEGTADNPNAGLLSSALAPVRTLVNNLWEPMALAYANAAGTPITADQIALTYSFTTSNDEKVLQYIAEPAAWFADQITTFARISAAKKVVGAARFFSGETLDPVAWDLNKDGTVSAADFDLDGDGSVTPADFMLNGDTTFDYEDVLIAADGSENAFPTNLPPNPESPLNPLFAGGACTGTVGAEAINCVAVALATNFRADLPTPLPGVNRNVLDTTTGTFDNVITIDNDTVKPVGLVSAVASAIPGSAGVLAAQGTVSLPYYLGTAPAEIAGPGALSWVADDILAAKLNQTFSSLGLSIPQADPARSTAVNYIFPFPKQRSEQEVPVLALYPAATDPIGAVIYQHGITTDRSAALTFGTALAAAGYVVIAIDQPLHGVAPFTAEEQAELAVKLLVAGGATVDQATQLAPLVIAGDVNELAAALGGGTATEESTAKAMSLINTVANAGSTIPGLAPTATERHFGIYADATGAPAAMSFDPANAAGTDGSGSLFINLANFLNVRDNMRQSAVDKMNLRVTLFGSPVASKQGLVLPRPTQFGGTGTGASVGAATPVYFAGHSLGTITGSTFVATTNADQVPAAIFTDESGATLPSGFNNVLAASMLTPGGGVVRLLENSPAFAPKILLGLQQAAGLTQGDANLETYFNVLQAAIDTADPINFADNLVDSLTPLALLEVPGDTVIPNSADAIWGGAPLSGTFTSNGVSVTIDSFNAPLAGTQPLALTGTAITTVSGGTHATPVSVDDAAVFGEMVGATLTLFGGAAPTAPQ